MAAVTHLVRSVITLVFLVLISTVSSSPQAAGPARTSGSVEDVTVPAPSLKGNLLGDPTTQPISVYLPPSYRAESERRYPVVYLLHGYTGNNGSWFETGSDGFNLKPILDDLMSSRSIGEMIVVAPNGNNALMGSFYVNSPVTGRWADHIESDVVGYVDKNYRTMARPASRGIAGHSMGGFGALSLSMRGPTFSAVYALSPCCLGMEGEFLESMPAWSRLGTLTSRKQLPKPISSFDDFFAHAFAAIGAAFSPNTTRPPFFSDTLYTSSGGKLHRNEAVDKRWRELMPVYHVEEKKARLNELRGIYLDFGEKEEFSHIRLATSRLSQELAARAIPHTFVIYPDGDHGSKIRERLQTTVFYFFSEKLDFTQ